MQCKQDYHCKEECESKNQQGVKIQTYRQPEDTKAQGLPLSFPLIRKSFSKRSKGWAFNLDYSLLVIAVDCQAAVWTTANCQLSGLAHCKHMIVLHTACVLFKFTCHQGPWLDLCDLAGNFYSCWKLPVIHFTQPPLNGWSEAWCSAAAPGTGYLF